VVYGGHSAAGGKQLAKQLAEWEKCLKMGERHGRIREFEQGSMELDAKSWLFEPHTRGKLMNQVSVYKRGKYESRIYTNVTYQGRGGLCHPVSSLKYAPKSS
jgi:hypothetical protein